MSESPHVVCPHRAAINRIHDTPPRVTLIAWPLTPLASSEAYRRNDQENSKRHVAG